MRATSHAITRYATHSDFCGIFQKDMNRLYLLSFLLTGDHGMAEKCFVEGLDNSAKANTVFREWAQSWARRVIVQNAVRMIRPRAVDSEESSGIAHHRSGGTAEMAEIVKLPPFDRFAYVMSVLERYSDNDCSLLLSCTRAQLSAAKIRAMQLLGKSAQSYRSLITTGPNVEAVCPRVAHSSRLLA